MNTQPKSFVLDATSPTETAPTVNAPSSSWSARFLWWRVDALIAVACLYILSAFGFMGLFALKVVSGAAQHHGFLETSSVPLLVLGAFLLLISVVGPHLQRIDAIHLNETGPTKRTVGSFGFKSLQTVALVHVLLGIGCVINHRPVVGGSILLLSLFLITCLVLFSLQDGQRR